MKLRSATLALSGEAGTSRSLALALTRGDLDAAAACFTRDGCLITPDATAIHGRDRIRPVLAQMVLQQIEIRVELSSRIVAGDVVLARERWQVLTGEPNRGRQQQVLHPILVLRQVEGTWKLSIVAPWQSRQGEF